MGLVIRTGTKVTTPPTVSSFKGSGLYQPRLGLEMEMVVADAATGASLPVQAYFDARSEEHTSELQSLMRISYAVFCLKKKKILYHNKITRRSYTTIRITTQHVLIKIT